MKSNHLRGFSLLISVIVVSVSILASVVGINMVNDNNSEKPNVNTSTSTNNEVNPKKPKTTNQNPESHQVDQEVYENFISYPDVYVSEKQNGKREYELTSGVANKLPESEDAREKLFASLSNAYEQIDQSYYNIVVVHDDGRKQAIPIAVSYCPEFTDVCRTTTENIDSVTSQSVRGDSQPVEMTSSVERLEFTAGGEVVDTMERPGSPLQIKSFTANESEVLGAKDKIALTRVDPSDVKEEETIGTTSDPRNEQNPDANGNKKYV